MRTTLFLLLFLSPFIVDAKGIFKRDKIRLIHIVDRNHITVVTKRYAYESMTADQFKDMFGLDLRTAFGKYKIIWSPL